MVMKELDRTVIAYREAIVGDTSIRGRCELTDSPVHSAHLHILLRSGLYLGFFGREERIAYHSLYEVRGDLSCLVSTSGEDLLRRLIATVSGDRVLLYGTDEAERFAAFPFRDSARFAIKPPAFWFSGECAPKDFGIKYGSLKKAWNHLDGFMHEIARG